MLNMKMSFLEILVERKGKIWTKTLKLTILYSQIFFINRKFFKKSIFKVQCLYISAHADGGPRSPSAHAWRSARPPIDTSGNFSAHMSGGEEKIVREFFWSTFSENFKNFSFFSKKIKIWGWCKIFEIFSYVSDRSNKTKKNISKISFA